MKKNITILGIILFYLTPLNAQTPTIKWWYDVLDSSFGQSAAGDIDNDGKMEIVFGCYRNDSSIYALNAIDGTLKWKFNAHSYQKEGCNDVAILIADTDNDDTLDVVVPSSCNPKTYCFRGKDGSIKWEAPTGGSDSPPTFADIDGDGKPEILHGGFDGAIRCFNAEDGSAAWTLPVHNNAWIQTAPSLVDLNGDGNLDIVVATWAFSPDTDKIYAFDGTNRNLLWSKPLDNHAYHGTAIGDIDNDGKPELIIGDYDGKLYVFNGENGSLLWTYQGQVYIGAPATLADVNHDGYCDIIFCDGYGVGVLDRFGSLMWYYSIPNYGQTFRGVAVADVTGDGRNDIVFGTQTGKVYCLNGMNGTLHWSVDLQAHIGKTFDINHAPLIADFDSDGLMDVFIVGGNTDYPNFSNNYGRAYLISTGPGHGPNWLMFQHDYRRLSNHCEFPVGLTNNETRNDALTIYPNPAKEQFIILGEFNGNVKIYNTLGQLIQTSKIEGVNSTVNVSNLIPGIYIIEAYNNNKYKKQTLTIY